MDKLIGNFKGEAMLIFIKKTHDNFGRKTREEAGRDIATVLKERHDFMCAEWHGAIVTAIRRLGDKKPIAQDAEARQELRFIFFNKGVKEFQIYTDVFSIEAQEDVVS